MTANRCSTSSGMQDRSSGRKCLALAPQLPLASLVDLPSFALMKGLRIIVLMLVVALGLSGWATHVHALADSPELGSSMPAADAKAHEAECAKASGSQARHDHSQGGDGLSCCHLMAPALELYSPSAYRPGWHAKPTHEAAHRDSATGVMPAPTLRPPRT